MYPKNEFLSKLVFSAESDIYRILKPFSEEDRLKIKLYYEWKEQEAIKDYIRSRKIIEEVRIASIILILALPLLFGIFKFQNYIQKQGLPECMPIEASPLPLEPSGEINYYDSVQDRHRELSCYSSEYSPVIICGETNAE